MKARSDRGPGGGEESLPNQSRFPPSSPKKRPKSSQITAVLLKQGATSRLPGIDLSKGQSGPLAQSALLPLGSSGVNGRKMG